MLTKRYRKVVTITTPSVKAFSSRRVGSQLGQEIFLVHKIDGEEHHGKTDYTHSWRIVVSG
jgi:hypothetical protein